MTSFEKDFVPKFPSYHLNAQNELETYLAKHPQRIRTTTILACSSRIVDGPLCQYRRGFFDHLKPRAFVTNSIRICIQQGSLIMANYMSEQLEQDLKRNELVRSGELTKEEADEQAEQWEKEEWAKRWTGFSHKLLTAFAKFHAVTIVMRTYEAIADKFYDKVTLDKLTMDTFQASLKVTAKSDKSNGTSVTKTMFRTTFWANMIAFMADYSVHQIILCYTYYTYVQRRKRKENKDQEEEGMNADAKSLLFKKSTQLMVSRSFGLYCSAAGGALGTIVWPGWGTLLLSNLGEGMAGQIVNDGQGSSVKD